MMKKLKIAAWVFVILGSFDLAYAANIEFGDPFADNMVLQRDMPVRVWG